VQVKQTHVFFTPGDMMPTRYTKQQLVQEAALSDDDMTQVRQCRRDHNRLGFAYQLGFVRLLNRFPRQLPSFEILEDLLAYITAQVALPAFLIDVYQQRQQTISEHQQRIATYLELRPFESNEVALLAQFIFEEAFRLEQTGALQARVKAFLKAQRILQPAESTIDRLIGEQRQRAREVIYERVTAAVPDKLVCLLDELLQVPADETASSLQRIKNNPRNPSPEAMLALLQKLQLIEATGILAVDLSWLNSNYQRALFHYGGVSPNRRFFRHSKLYCLRCLG